MSEQAPAPPSDAYSWASEFRSELEEKDPKLIAPATGPVLVENPAPPREIGIEFSAPPVAILVGLVAAVAGGLVWAGVVIATGYDIGILAWLVGAATGFAIARTAVRPVGPVGRVTAGIFAAGGIMVGKYVIFVHAVKKSFGTELAAAGRPVSYFGTRQMSIFVHNLSAFVKPIYILWVGLAFVAAVRTAARHSRES